MVKSQELILKSKNKEEAIIEALKRLNVQREDIEVEVIEKESKGFLGFIGTKPGTYKIVVVKNNQEEVPVKEEVLVKETKTEEQTEISLAENFIKDLLRNSSITAEVVVTKEDNLIKVDIQGKEAGALIGRRGETLDSIQLLTGLALNKVNKNSHMRVLVDIENYRAKREESLVRYARKVAREVAKTRRTKKLDYMNPYERRIVHSALQNDKYVITYSEGTDPYRRLVIEYKK